jgi:hypothetical protein
MIKKDLEVIILLTLMWVGVLTYLANIKPLPTNQPLVKGAQSSLTITATVGSNQLTLSGHASPQSKVILNSSTGNLYTEAVADEKGYFIFKEVLLPLKVGELSLIAIDTEGLSSPPLFLPEPPSNQDLLMTDILLPPTISLSTGQNSTNQESAVTGKTFPNSPLVVYLYNEPETILGSHLWNLIVHQVWAKAAPLLEIQSSLNGDYEVNLPSVEPAVQRIFVASLFDKNYSPKSFTLSFATLSIWGKIGRFFGQIWEQTWAYFSSLGQDPSKIIWLEIPLLLILFLGVTLRWAKEKYFPEQDFEERRPVITQDRY